MTRTPRKIGAQLLPLLGGGHRPVVTGFNRPPHATELFKRWDAAAVISRGRILGYAMDADEVWDLDRM